jgi:type II secretion system (T2SS) protein E
VTIAETRNTELARAQGLAERANLLWIDLDAERIDPAAVATIPLELAETVLAVPFGFDGPLLRIAIAGPATRAELLEQIDMPHEFVVAPRASVVNVLGSLRQTRRGAGSVVAVQSPLEDGAEIEMASVGRAADSGSMKRASSRSTAPIGRSSSARAAATIATGAIAARSGSTN